MFQSQEEKERKRQQQAEYLKQLERDIQDKQSRQINDNDQLPIIPKNKKGNNVPTKPPDNVSNSIIQQKGRQYIPQQQPSQQRQIENIDLSLMYNDLELVKQALVDEMKGRQLLEQRVRPQIDTIMDQMSTFLNETVSSSTLAQRLMKLESDNSIISNKVNSYGSRVEMVGDHLSKMSRAMLAEEANRIEAEGTMKYLVRESQDQLQNNVEELRQFIMSKYNTIETLQNNILEIKEDVENTHKLPGFALLQAASGTKQPNSVLEALVAKVAKMSTDLENQKEINASLSRELVTIRDNLSQETAQSHNLSTELRSVLSAEITARRKGFTKINETVEKLVLTQKDELISMRKEFQMLAENITMRMEASENHINNTANTVLREIRETREFARKGIESLELEVRNVQEQILDQRRGNNNNDERISPSKKGSINSSSNNYSEADVVSRILILEDNVDKKLRAEAGARFEGDTVLRDFIDSIQLTLGKKLEDTVGRMKSLISQKLDEHEIQMDVNIKQILTDVSEEIAFCINEESDRRFEEIQASENRIYDLIGAPRRSTPNIQNNLEQTAARLGSRIQTPEKGSNRNFNLVEDNDSYIPTTPPKLPEQFNREEEEEEERAAIMMQSLARKRIANKQIESLRKEQSVKSNYAKDVAQSPLVVQTSTEKTSPIVDGNSSPVVVNGSASPVSGSASPAVSGSASSVANGNTSPAALNLSGE